MHCGEYWYHPYWIAISACPPHSSFLYPLQDPHGYSLPCRLAGRHDTSCVVLPRISHRDLLQILGKLLHYPISLSNQRFFHPHMSSIEFLHAFPCSTALRP